MPPAERIPAAAVPSTARLARLLLCWLYLRAAAPEERDGTRLVNLGDVRDHVGFTVEKEVAKSAGSMFRNLCLSAQQRHEWRDRSPPSAAPRGQM